MLERAAGEPLASAAQLRAILELSLRLASIDDIGGLIGVLARELSQLIPFDDLTLTLQDVARDGAARYALDTRTGTLALREPEGDGGDALESSVIEQQRPVCPARSDADAPTARLERGRESVELVHAVGRSILSILDLPELLRSVCAVSMSSLARLRLGGRLARLAVSKPANCRESPSGAAVK